MAFDAIYAIVDNQWTCYKT